MSWQIKIMKSIIVYKSIVASHCRLSKYSQFGSVIYLVSKVSKNGNKATRIYVHKYNYYTFISQ